MGANNFNICDIEISIPKIQDKKDYYNAGLKNVVIDTSEYYWDDAYQQNDVLDRLSSLIEETNNGILNKKYTISQKTIAEIEKELLKLYSNKKEMIQDLRENDFYGYYEINNLQDFFENQQMANDTKWNNIQIDYNTGDRILIQPDVAILDEIYFSPLDLIINQRLENKKITNEKNILEIKLEIFKPLIKDLNNQMFSDCDALVSQLEQDFNFNRENLYFIENNRAGIEKRIPIDDLEEYKLYKENIEEENYNSIIQR
ncbi:hypothetical protein [Mycoplasma sp. 2634B]|uniref:hypothetical protein n=1 Tax=Mycoplasma sp. 2634B TaxID=3401692 RepID=UPI003AAD7A94